jgi:hypothetical protein
MNYKSIYDKIVEKTKERKFSWTRTEEYFERHHIIPKCLGGSNKKENLTMMTAKEHYVCHHLLWKIYKDDKRLALAFHKMKSSNMKSRQIERKFSLSAKEYENLRTDIASAFSKRIVSKETCNRISETKKLKYSMLSDERRNELRLNAKNCLSKPEVRAKMSQSAKGKKHSWNNKKGSAGSLNPKAKKCYINDVEFGCIKDAISYAKEHFKICSSAIKKRFKDPNDFVFVKEVK